MANIIPDLTFLVSEKKLWEKKVFEKIEECISIFKERDNPESKEDCFKIFCLDFESAKYNFMNKIRDIQLIMKCRTKADNNSKFGGQQCAEFMQDIQAACNKYLNTTVYSDNNSGNSQMYVIKSVRDMAKSSEIEAWEFENKARDIYASTGKDITLDIIKQTMYPIGGTKK